MKALAPAIYVFLWLLAGDAWAQPAPSPPFVEIPTSDNPRLTVLDQKVDSLVNAFLKKTQPVGISLGILKQGKTIFYNYGETAKGSGQLPDQATLYEIGSISKTFTATLLADAARRGKVDADASVNSFLPDSIPFLQKANKPVTLKMLANHTSGLPRVPTNLALSPILILNPYKEYDRRQLFAYLMTAQLQREPGKEIDYSNLGAGLLGTLLENALNEDYEDLLHKRITGPLGLTNTTLTLSEEQQQHFAQGHDGRGNKASAWEFKALAGAGGIRSTTEDMLRYLAAELGDGPRTLVRAMQATQERTAVQGKQAIGLGWFWQTDAPQPWLWHNGRTGGFSTFAAFNPRLKKAVVVLINSQVQSDLLGASLLTALEEL